MRQSDHRLQPIHPNDPIRIDPLNAVVDVMIRQRSALGLGQAETPVGTVSINRPISEEVLVRNDSDTAVDRGDVLAIAGPLTGYEVSAEDFIDRPAFSGVLPLDPEHIGLYVVVLEPLAAGDPEADPPTLGEIGRCAISGAVLAKVRLRVDAGGTPIGDKYAEIVDGSYVLQSCGGGSSRILIAEPAAVPTDPAWCYIRLGESGIFDIAEVQSVGSTTLSCKWIDGEGAATGSAFTVNVYSYTDEDESVGGVDLAETYPSVAVGQFIRVYRQPRTEWNGTAWVNGYWAVDRFDLACAGA